MSWFSSLFKKKEITGTELVVSALNEQVCNLLEVPIQKLPRVVVVKEDSKIAEYDAIRDTIYIYGEKNASSGVVAHELAHSILYKYGQYNTRIHEIVAGYAEYKLKGLIPNG